MRRKLELQLSDINKSKVVYLEKSCYGRRKPNATTTLAVSRLEKVFGRL